MIERRPLDGEDRRHESSAPERRGGVQPRSQRDALGQAEAEAGSIAVLSVVRSKSTAFPQAEFSRCISVHMGLLPTRSQRSEKPAGGTGRAAEPHSSQTYFSERPHRLHRKVMKPGLVSLTSCPATIMSVPQSRHAGSSPVSKG
jgi:hypothetical protein